MIITKMHNLELDVDFAPLGVLPCVAHSDRQKYIYNFMGFIVEGKLLKFKDTFLFQRKCDKCEEKYLFQAQEALTNKCFVCERCIPFTPTDAEYAPRGYGVRITSWENRVTSSYKRDRTSTKNYKKVFQRDQGVCQYCFNDGNTIDHIIPVSYGGSNKEYNLVCCCDKCNQTVGSMVFDNFYDKRAYILYKRKKYDMGKSI